MVRIERRLLCGAAVRPGRASRRSGQGPSPEADSPANAEAKAEAPAKPALKAPLDREQKRLADRYAELEKAMNRMAEVVGQTDPKQAALLRQAFAESRQRLLDDRFLELVAQLEKDQLYVATKGQVQVEQDLQKLLELLQSGDRASRPTTSASSIRRSSLSSKN